MKLRKRYHFFVYAPKPIHQEVTFSIIPYKELSYYFKAVMEQLV